MKDSTIRFFSIFVVFCSFVLLFFYVNLHQSSFSYSMDYIKVGDLVNQDIVANVNLNFTDRKGTEEKYNNIRKNTPRIYYSDDSRVYHSIVDFNKVYADIETHSTIEKALNEIYKRKYFDFSEISSDSADSIVLDGQTIPKKDLIHVFSVDDFLKDNFNITETSVPSSSEIKNYLVPNARLDYIKSLDNIENIIANTKSVIINYKKGDVIIARDEIISVDQLNELRTIREGENKITAYKFTFKIIVSLLVFFFSFYAIYSIFKKKKNRANQNFYLTCFAELVYIFATLLMYVGMNVVDNFYFLDSRSLVLFPSLFVLSVTDDKFSALLVMFMNIVLLFILPFTTIALVSKSIVITVLIIIIHSRNISFKNSIFRIIGIIAIYLVLTLLINISFYPTCSILFQDFVYEIIKLVVIFIINYVFVSIFEDYLDMSTVRNLSRLAFEKSDILDKFKQNCPGSYEHSEAVSRIAEDAARAINCDYLLVKVAARYHDVGKTEHPEYFIENQHGESKHKNISSKLSASIIKSHVSLGVKMLESSDIGMPREVINIISEHHGNDLISYFYFEAKKEMKEDEIMLDDFRYDSNRPSSKESAVLMLSDIAEAASRSLGEYTMEELDNFIQKLFDSKVKNHQLDDSSLTIGEFFMLKNSIVKTISDLFHKRIKYNNENDDK